MKTYVNPWKFLVAIGFLFIIVLLTCGTVLAQEKHHANTWENEVRIKGKFINTDAVDIAIYEDGHLMVQFTADKRFKISLDPSHHYKVIFADKYDEDNQKIMYVRPNESVGLYTFPLHIDFGSSLQTAQLVWDVNKRHFDFKPVKYYGYE